jgi:hypothetical protein
MQKRRPRGNFDFMPALAKIVAGRISGIDIVRRRIVPLRGCFRSTARLAPCPLVDSPRLRRPSAPPVRSAKPPQGPVPSLRLHLDPAFLRPLRRHPPTVGSGGPPHSTPLPRARLASLLRLRRVDSSRLRRPPAPPIRSATTASRSGRVRPLHLDPVFAPPTPPPPASGRLRRLPKTPSAFFISVSRRRGGLLPPGIKQTAPPSGIISGGQGR